MRVICPYCGKKAKLVTGDKLRGRQEFSHKKFWLCRPCQAWVGCHAGSSRNAPLGSLANKTLRRLRGQAHSAFDPLWKAKMSIDKCSKAKARGAGYKWLSAQLGIDPKHCHIGMFQEDLCKRTIEICKSVPRKGEITETKEVSQS